MKKNIWKRPLCLLLTVCMAVSLLVTAGSAGDAADYISAFKLKESGGVSYTGSIAKTAQEGEYSIVVSVPPETLFDETNMYAYFTAAEGTVLTVGGAELKKGDALDLSGTEPIEITATKDTQSQTYFLSIDSTEAKGVNQPYTLSIEPETTDYNRGDTVNYEIYAKCSDGSEYPVIGSYDFSVSYDSTYLTYEGYSAEGDSFSSVNSSAGTGSVKIASAIGTGTTSADGITATPSGVLLGTVSFTVTAVPGAGQSATIAKAGIQNPVVTPKGQNHNSATITTVTGSDVKVHNLTVSFVNGKNNGTEATTGVSGTAYVKYGVQGLYTSNDYSTSFTVPTPTAKDGYVLWDGNNAHTPGKSSNYFNWAKVIVPASGELGDIFALTGGTTESITVAPTVYKTVAVTLAEGEGVTWTSAGEKTMLKGQSLASEFTRLGITAPAVKTGFDGSTIKYYIGSSEIDKDTYVIQDSAVTITADASKVKVEVELPGTDDNIEGIYKDKDGDGKLDPEDEKITDDDTPPDGKGEIEYGDDLIIKIEQPNPDTENQKVIRDSDVTYQVDKDGDGFEDEEEEQPEPGRDEDNKPDGTYHIPGDKVTGPIKVNVNKTEYVVVTFEGGNATLSTANTTAYAVKSTTNSEKLYASMDDFIKGSAGTEFSVPVQTAKNNFRLDLLGGTNQQWTRSDNSEKVATSQLSPLQATFNENTTLTAATVATVTYTVTAGANGSVSPSSVTVDAGSDAEQNAKGLVTCTPNTGYEFDEWTVSGNTLTATFKAKTVEFKLASGSADTATISNVKRDGTDLTGGFPYSVTYGSDGSKYVTFTITGNANKEITAVSYTVDSQAPVSIYPSTWTQEGDTLNGDYSIPLNKFYDVVILTVSGADTRTVTFTAGSAGHGTVTGVIVVKKDTAGVLADWASQVTAVPDTGYVQDGWYDNAGCTGNDLTDSIATATISDNTTYYAKFVLAERTMTDGTGVIDEIISGANGPINGKDMGDKDAEYNGVKYGTPVVFTVDDDEVISKIEYSPDGGNNWYELEADGDGKYEVPADRITDDLTIRGTTLADEIKNLTGDPTHSPVTVEFISRENYAAITDETEGVKILVLNGTKSTEYFRLSDGTVLFWSAKYNAHVAWVDSSETAKSIAGKLSFNKDLAPAAISYTGDINGDGSVNSEDAGIVNDCLHGVRQVPTSARQLFMLDVESAGTTAGTSTGYKCVTAADVTWILLKTVNPTSLPETDDPAV